MPKLNWDVVKWNVAEAREELESIERLIANDEMSEAGLEVRVVHAFHHLNFAWNARRASTDRYSKCAKADFNKWGQFPTDIELLKIES
jgi:hypothetical protein